MVKIEQIPALGTYWWFELMDADPAAEAALTELLTARLNEFDATYSRFTEESLVYRLNTEGFLLLKEVPNPEELLELLSIGLKLYEDTEGVFNFLTAGIQVEAGYGQSDSVRTRNTDDIPNPLTDLEISDTEIRVHNGAVDMGGFAKGWLIDDITAMLQEEVAIQHVLINGGGDMFATSEPDGSPIDIMVEHPSVPDTFIAKIPLLNQGFAASSTLKRAWEKDGEETQHILKTHDESVASHVIAEDAMTADIFATLSCIIDPEDAADLLEAEELDFLLMSGDQAAMSPNFEEFILKDD
jgi:thiamine biosynthesis lipoprotein